MHLEAIAEQTRAAIAQDRAAAAVEFAANASVKNTRYLFATAVAAAISAAACLIITIVALIAHR